LLAGGARGERGLGLGRIFGRNRACGQPAGGRCLVRHAPGLPEYPDGNDYFAKKERNKKEREKAGSNHSPNGHTGSGILQNRVNVHGCYVLRCRRHSLQPSAGRDTSQRDTVEVCCMRRQTHVSNNTHNTTLSQFNQKHSAAPLLPLLGLHAS